MAAANAALPQVRLLLDQARGHLAPMLDLEAQMQDLRIVWGEQVLAVACPGHAEFAGYLREHGKHRASLHEVLLRLHGLGVEVKDVQQGLVDFRGHVADTPAYLCWRSDEPRVAHWHPIEGGFAARRPVPELPG